MSNPDVVSPEEIAAQEAARGPLPDTVAPEDAVPPTAAPEVPQRDPAVCVNCGQPSTQMTTNPGANVDYYCDACGAKAYPENLGQLQRIDAGTTPGDGVSGGSGPVIRLKDGSTAADPRLGRVKQFDARSRSFPMTAVLDELTPKDYKPRSHTWPCDQHYDQGPDGSCVGHAWAHELRAKPVVIDDIDHAFALWIYKTAQKYDEWPGTNYDGTSVLAGAKVIQGRPPAMPEGRGLMGEYRWIFGDIDDLIKTLGYFGPVVLGTNWYAGMMDADADGFIHRTGDMVGGHAILIKGVKLAPKTKPATSGAVRLHNSWGESWGQGGDCWLSIADLETLLGEQGELCVPVHRMAWG